MGSRLRPDGGPAWEKAQTGDINLASLSTLARPGVEFRRRQALAILEANDPNSYKLRKDVGYANWHRNTMLRGPQALPLKPLVLQDLTPTH